MEQNSQPSGVEQQRRLLEGQLRECFGRVVYSHKTHEKCADILLTRQSRIKLWQIVLSAITAGGVLSTLFGSGDVGAIFSLIVSTTLLVLNAYTKKYDLGELAQKHRQTATDLWLVRETYLSLLTDLRMNTGTVDDLRTQRDQLSADLHAIYEGAPSTTHQAYRKAQRALKHSEDMTFTEAEIDAFLPTDLRRQA